MNSLMLAPFSVPFLPLTLGGLTSFFLCIVIILSGRWHSHLTHDYTDGIQKFHSRPTPRVGGVTLISGLVVTWLFSSPVIKNELRIILLASLPAFFFGFAEDLTKKVSPKMRLIATMCSGLLAHQMTGLSITRVDLPVIDLFLSWLPISIIFTAFAVAGIANAINIIDGFHGLAAGTVLVSLGSLGYISYLAGDIILAKICFVLAGIVFGFFLVNYPFGKIFLGDGGAYLLGFWVGWIAVVLVARNPGVSAWSALLACAYPITEVIFSVYRRVVRGSNPGHPDRLHLHSLVKTRFVRKRFTHIPLLHQNPIVSLFMWIFAVLPALLGIIFYKDTLLCLISYIIFVIGYLMTYLKIVRFS